MSSDDDDSDDDDEDDDESEDEVLPQSSRTKAAAARNAHSAAKKASSSTVNIDGEDITVVNINNGAGPSRQKRKDEGDRPHSSKDSNNKTSSKRDATAMNDAKPSTSRDTSETNSVYGSTRSGTSFKDGSDVEIEEEKEWYDEFLQEDDEYNRELSGKLVLLMEILADAEAVHDKVLVFSQSLVTLDLIEKMLGGGEIGGDRENWCRGCDYFRMDGSTSAAMRQRWADIFNDEDNRT